MIVAPAGVKVHLALGHTDMRKGLDGLATLIQEHLKKDPFSDHLFVLLTGFPVFHAHGSNSSRRLARCFAPLSTCSTARIQCSGTLKRFDASVTNAAKGRTDKSFGRRVADDPCSTCAGPPDNIEAAKITTMRSIVPRDRKAAIVLAAVKGEALARRPSGRPGPPLRATAVQMLAGTEQWPVSNKGMTEDLQLCGKVIPPRRSKEAPPIR
jgi:hypothetical protein